VSLLLQSAEHWFLWWAFLRAKEWSTPSDMSIHPPVPAPRAGSGKVIG
jgi:hypothetical protein